MPEYLKGRSDTGKYVNWYKHTAPHMVADYPDWMGFYGTSLNDAMRIEIYWMTNSGTFIHCITPENEKPDDKA